MELEHRDVIERRKGVFVTLNAINCNSHTEQKNGLTYLSWAWAWAAVKKAYPLAFYTIYEDARGCNYFTDGKTCWVKTGVTIEGLEYIEYLPVMDYRNNSIPFDNVKSVDVNKAIQRSLTKACARHGLGLYIYAGEDLPEDSQMVAVHNYFDNVANSAEYYIGKFKHSTRDEFTDTELIEIYKQLVKNGRMTTDGKIIEKK